MTFRSHAPGNGQNMSFPKQPRSNRPKASSAPSAGDAIDPAACSDAENLSNAFAGVSRRITDLARQLKCLGYFDDNDGRPRAA